MVVLYWFAGFKRSSTHLGGKESTLDYLNRTGVTFTLLIVAAGSSSTDPWAAIAPAALIRASCTGSCRPTEALVRAIAGPDHGQAVPSLHLLDIHASERHGGS